MLDHTDVLDRAFHALSDPARRQMLGRLAEGSASVSELARPLPMTLAAVVQHVQVLEAAGLVESHKIGRVRTCSIRRDGMRSAEQWLTDRRDIWERRLDRLGEVLDEQAASETTSPNPRARRKRGPTS